MKYIVIAILMAAIGACKKNELGIVEKFVREVKEERFQEMSLPPFNKSHIEALLSHASDEQEVSNYPRPSYSSYYGGPVKVGLVMLYAIEAARRQVDWPSLSVRVFDEQDLSRTVSLDEALLHYHRWWAANKNKSVEELKLINPLEGSGLTWQIYTTAE